MCKVGSSGCNGALGENGLCKGHFNKNFSLGGENGAIWEMAVRRGHLG